MDERIQRFVTAADRARQARSRFATVWDQIQQFLWPDGQRFNARDPAGSYDKALVFDNRPAVALDRYVAGIMGLAANAAQQWFQVEAEDPDLAAREEVAAWFEIANKRAQVLLASAEIDFYPQLIAVLYEWGAYGTGTLYIARQPGWYPIVQARALGEVLAEDDGNGRLRRAFREFKLTVQQAFDQWGADAGPKVAEAMAKGEGLDREVDFLHAVEPRGNLQGAGPRSLPWASIVINVSESHVVREGGYEDNPFIVARDSRRPGEAYGRGRGWKALDEIKMLQRIGKTTIRAAEKATDPPLLVYTDSLLSPVQTGLSGLTHVQGDVWGERGDPVRALNTGARPDVGEQFAETRRKVVDDIFFADLLDIPRDPRATATQVLKVDEEQRRKLSPHLIQLYNQLFDPAIEKLFRVFEAEGAFPPRPEILRGRRFRIRYVSPLARALMGDEVTSLDLGLQVLLPLSQVDPSVLDVLDTEEAGRDSLERLGVPRRWLRDQAGVAALRQARAQAQAQAQQVEEAAKLGGAIGAAAPALQQLAGGQAGGNG